MTYRLQVVKAFDQRMGMYRYVASNQVPPEVFNRLVAEDERRKEASMVQKNGGHAAGNAAFEKARAEGFAVGAAQERKRFGAIMSSKAAQGRRAQAMNLALDTDLSAETVVALLGKSPKETSGLSTIEQRAEVETDRIWARARKEAGITASEDRPSEREREGATSVPTLINAEAADDFWADVKKEAGA